MVICFGFGIISLYMSNTPGPAKFELTGGMGSGKSSVGKILEGLGAAVFDTDVIATELQEPGGIALPPMVEILGEEIIDDAGHLDRAKAGKLMFADPTLLQRINEALHPMIWETTLERVGQVEDGQIAVIEVPVPDRAHEAEMDGIVSVITPPQLAVQRLVEGNRKIARDVAEDRIRSQISNEEREAMSNFIIVNAGSFEALRIGA